MAVTKGTTICFIFTGLVCIYWASCFVTTVKQNILIAHIMEVDEYVNLADIDNEIGKNF